MVRFIEHRLDAAAVVELEAHVDGCRHCERLLAALAGAPRGEPPLRLQPSQYELVRRLGAGGMGEVFLANRLGAHGFRKPVALKRMLSTLAADRSLVRLFIDEGRLVAKLAHRHIAQVYELGEDLDGLFVAQEYVAGPSLRMVLDRLSSDGMRLPPVVARDVAVQLASALDAVHAAVDEHGEPLQIVHRDVSPQNLLFSPDGDLKLIDFGVARSAGQEHSTHAGERKGKLAYMSPEQSAGLELDGRSDLFALGVVLTEMLTGRHPFAGADVLRTVEAIRRDPPRLPSETDASLAPFDGVVSKLLEKSPDARFSRGSEVVEALGALELPPASRPLSFWLRVGSEYDHHPSPRRHRVWPAAVALVFALVFALVAVEWVPWPRSPASLDEEPAPPVTSAPPTTLHLVPVASPRVVKVPRASPSEPVPVVLTHILVLNAPQGPRTFALSVGEAQRLELGGAMATFSLEASDGEALSVRLETDPPAFVAASDRVLGRTPLSFSLPVERATFLELQRPGVPNVPFSLKVSR